MRRRRYFKEMNFIYILIIKLILLLIINKVNSKQYNVPNECEINIKENTNKNALTCKIRTINSNERETINFTKIDKLNTNKLIIICDDILYESSLKNNSLKHLNELEELFIDKCKLREINYLTLNGLIKLKNLTIRTYNELWGDQYLQINTLIFNNLKLLERIDLTHNNLLQLPEKIFCSLNKLKYLNLSVNSFSELNNIGLSQRHSSLSSSQLDNDYRSSSSQSSSLLFNNLNNNCKISSLQYLDLSENKIKVLTDRGFSLSSKLKHLILSHNQISRAEETSLYGLTDLEILDLSNNELVALPPRFFNHVKKTLNELHLQNNSITVLPPGLFVGLTQLTHLDLSLNEITSHWINLDTFADLVHLKYLDLSNNRLSKIDSITFRSQSVLETLNIHHNDIEIISENAFSSLYKLETLVLNNNRLLNLDITTFNGLNSLFSLHIDNNQIQTLDNELFKNLTILMELNVARNNLKTVPHSLSYLHSLRSLDLSYNHIENIDNTSYQGNEQLYSLTLQGNHIGNLSKGVFKDLPSLRILNLANNNIKSIELGTFDDVPDLHALRLDSNSLQDINNLFNNLRDLLMLNISVNQIIIFDYAMIPIGLQWLDMHDNHIDHLGNFYDLEKALKLRTLDCSKNRLNELEPASLPDGIEFVHLQSNLITKIAPFTFMEKQNLTRIDLTNNLLKSLDMNSFRLSKVRTRRPLPEFNLSNNPYLCDCNMEWLKRLSGNLDESRQYPNIVDINIIECQLTFKKHEKNVLIKNADTSQFLCPYKSHCFALCHCCEFDACDCEMTCPDNCTCYYEQSWNTNIVDCSISNHLYVPKRIPMDVTELYLDGNKIQQLSSHTFIGRKNLRILHLNNSEINLINNRTFNGLKQLQILNLNHNHLTQLNGYEFERLFELKELYLSYNHISIISNTTFLALKYLQILHLDHNYISEYELWILNINKNLFQIQLSSNDWSCECTYLEQVLLWLPDNENKIKDLDRFQCNYNDTINVKINSELNLTRSCTNYAHKRRMFAQRFHVDDFVPIFVIIGSSLIIVLFIFVVILIYRHEMSVWFYSKYGVRLSRSNNQQTGTTCKHRNGTNVCNDHHHHHHQDEKLFDAFISYSKKDENFITQYLTPELEYNSLSYRLCLHYRDLPVASGYLSDAIVEAMDASSRTILILSENFIKNEWCRYEFKSAHIQVLHNNLQKLIVILYGKICTKDLDPELRFWLKNSTIIQWEEKLFWQKLRYALPDITYTRKQSTTEQTRDLTVAIHI